MSASGTSSAAQQTFDPSMSVQPILHSLNYSLNFIKDQVSDIDIELMVIQPAGITNHPAWTIGHLAYVLQLIGSVIGLEMELSDEWVMRHGPDSTPISDPDGYNSKEELISKLRYSADRLRKTIERLNATDLAQAFPDPDYRTIFPSIGHALTQVLCAHTAFHVGQLSVWRRAMGLRPMGKSYE